MAELTSRPTKTRSRTAKAQKIRVTHFAETRAHFFEFKLMEADGTHKFYIGF
jgi:hypothetical protein